MRDPLKPRFAVLLLICFVTAGVLLSRAAWLQVMQNPRLERMAQKQFQSKVLLQPKRGAIVDRNGEPLAINSESESLAINPNKIENKRITARLLAKALDLAYPKLLVKLSEKREFAWIKRQLTDIEMTRLKHFGLFDAEGNAASGLWLIKESKRIYPHGELASHILGEVNIDSEGSEGVELWQNEHLRGKGVPVNAVKDALGRPTFIDAVAARNVKDGEPVQLTLDASLQYNVEEELKASLKKTGAASGSVIVMNAANGEILAMANAPTFNPNLKGEPSERRRNRGLTDGYEPGSTLKAVLLAGALSHGMKLSDQFWGGEGQFVVQGKKISEAEAKDKFSWLSLKKMIQLSSNVVAAKLGLKLGQEVFEKTLKDFGFGARSPLGFPGEISGRIPGGKWQPLTTANIAFGQGILVTPLQMIRAYATFLNGGWLVSPTLIKSVDTKPTVTKPIISPAVSAQVLEALESVTDEKGTGVKARLPGYQVAGKTGTAQELDPLTHHYSRTHHVASFIGGATRIEPKIVILALLEDPKGVYFAAETAAPLFQEVLNSVANRFSLPTRPDLISPEIKSGSRSLASLSGSTLHTSQAHPLPINVPPRGNLEWLENAPQGLTRWKMPSLIGLTAREVIRSFAGHHFQFQIRGIGVVSTQVPEEGKALTDNDVIQVHLAEP